MLYFIKLYQYPSESFWDYGKDLYYVSNVETKEMLGSLVRKN